MINCALIIVDDAAVLRQAQTTLRDAGFLVVPVDDANLAIELLKRASYDVVIADMNTFRRADGTGQVSKKLSMLLYKTQDAPVVLGTSHPGTQTDLVDLTDPAALVRRVAEDMAAWQCRRAQREEDTYPDEEDLVYSGYID